VLSAADYLGKVKLREPYAAEAIAGLRKLLDSGERRFFGTAFRSLGRAAGSIKDENSEASDETAEYFIDYYNNKDPGDENRREIISAVGAAGSKAGVPFLAEIAGNNEERITLRIAALDALSKIGEHDEGLPAILSSISAADPNVRSSAIAALGPYTGDEVDNAILEAFRDSYYRTRIAASQAAKERKLLAAIPYLKFRAERDDVPQVKDEAIRALGAINNDETATILETLFSERKNSDRVRILASEMLMKNWGTQYMGKLVAELDEAKRKNQTVLYNGFLKVIGEARTESIQSIAGRFLTTGGIIEKSYGLDMALNNKLTSLSEEIKKITQEKNESLARKARNTLEKLGITE
jgi:hypothetical protein